MILISSNQSNDCWIEILLWSSIDSMGTCYINSGCWMVQRYIRLLVAKLSVMIMFLQVGLIVFGFSVYTGH